MDGVGIVCMWCVVAHTRKVWARLNLEFGMAFMERARALYDRGDQIRAAFVLAEGVKRQPDHEDGLNWFLQIYIQEVDSPGLEQELVRVLETQPDGPHLLDAVCQELEHRNDAARLAYLKRVCQLRHRTAEANETLVSRPAVAAAAEPEVQPDPADEVAEHLDVLIDPETGEPLPLPRRRRRRRRRAPRTEQADILAKQGVLPLDTREPTRANNWKNFTGLASDDPIGHDPIGLPASRDNAELTAEEKANQERGKTAHGLPPVIAKSVKALDALPAPRPERKTRRRGTGSLQAVREAQAAAAQAQPIEEEVTGQPMRIGSDALDTHPSTAAPREASDVLSEMVTTAKKYDAGVFSAIDGSGRADIDNGAQENTTSGTLEAVQARTQRLKQGRVERPSSAALKSAAHNGPADGGDQLIAVHDDPWVFGKLGDTVEEDPRTSAERPRRRQLPRVRPHNPVTPRIMGGMSRGLRWTTAGFRGPAILLLVAVLGAGGFGYRACTNFVDDQLTEADQSLELADGAALLHAIELYDEHMSTSDRSARSERLDFANALLAFEFGQDRHLASYAVEEAHSVFGAAAVILGYLDEGNTTMARPEAEAALVRFEDEWMAHWLRGTVAATEADWDRAQRAFQSAHELDDQAVLPLVGLADLALRSAHAELADQHLLAVEALNPEHPFVPVARAVLAFGIDPFDTRVGALEVELPNPDTNTLSQRSQELVLYVRARQALASWELDRLGAVMRQLHARLGPDAGLRVNLLHAVFAAREYAIDDVDLALVRASRAAPQGTQAQALVTQVGARILADLGRPDLALQQLVDDPANEMLRAKLLVETGSEGRALSLLDRLMNQPSTQMASLRILVDFHLRRGVDDRARLRASGLQSTADLAYGAARLAMEDLNWDVARTESERALANSPADLASLDIWARASARLGMGGHAMDLVDEQASRAILLGEFDRIRLEILLISGAPRQAVADFVNLLQSSRPTSLTVLGSLARAYETIGDSERAREAAEQVLTGEPNNREMHALLGRLLASVGEPEQSADHLRAYLALARETDPTDWARTLLATLDDSTG